MSESGAVPQRTFETAGTRRGIVVLDFGGQYTQLIARRIREQEVFSAILPCTASIDEERGYEPVGVVLSAHPAARHPGAGYLLRHAVAHLQPRRKSGTRGPPRIRPRAARNRAVVVSFCWFAGNAENLE